MHDVEKRSSVLENAAGVTRLDTHTHIYIYGPVTKWQHLGTLGKQTSHSPNVVQIRMPWVLVS